MFHLPQILGEEFVGTVETAGTSTSFKPGDAVAGWIYGGGKAHDGAYAHYTLCHSRRCFSLPSSSLPWSTLGGIFMSMWTAWGSLFLAAQLAPNSVVLVHGATSSVGLFAILLAKDHACTVIATTRNPDKRAKLEAAGADHVLLESELGSSRLRELYPKGVDCILELVGPDQVLAFALPHLARHGSVVVTGVLSKEWAVEGFSPAAIPPTRKLTFYTMADEEEMALVPGVMAEAVRKVESGAWKADVFVSRVFEGLETVGEAHEYMEESRAVGKVVLVVP